MMTKEEYMSDSQKNYRAYYAQFVTDAVKNLVRSSIGVGPIVRSSNTHMNDIHISNWEALHARIEALTRSKVLATGHWFDIYVSVSIAKAAARQIADEEWGKIRDQRPLAEVSC